MLREDPIWLRKSDRIKVKLMNGASNEDYKGGQRESYLFVVLTASRRRFERLLWLSGKSARSARNVFEVISATVTGAASTETQNVCNNNNDESTQPRGTVFQNIFLRRRLLTR